MSVSKKSSRGIATAAFLSKIPEDKLYMKFDENNMPKHDDPQILTNFCSYYGMMVQHLFPINIQMCKFENIYFDNLWAETKQAWKIETDTPKQYMKKWAVKLGTNFRSRLAREFIYKAEPNPDAQKAYEKYTFIDEEDWKSFVEQKTSEESLAKREKAKASSSMKKNTATVGREGYRGLKRKQCDIWPKLEERYPGLKGIENPRSRLYIMGHAIKDKKNKLYSLDENEIKKAHNLDQEEKNMIANQSYFENKEDPLVKVLGREHGGRSRTVSSVIGYTRVHGGLFKNVNNSGNSVQGDACSDGPINYPPIMNETQCELLINVGDSLVKVAEGKAWPTANAVLHFKPIPIDCVKVTVDGIVDLYKELDVYNVTKTDEIDKVKSLAHQIVQWPRKAIRLVNQMAPSKSTTASRVELSSSSPGHTSDSSQFHNENFASSSFYRLYDVDDNVPEELQLQQNFFDGGFVNALISMDQQQAGTNAQGLDGIRRFDGV